MEQQKRSDKVMDTLLGKNSKNANNIAKNKVFNYTEDRGDINGGQEINQGRNTGNFEKTENESSYETNSERNSDINEPKGTITEQSEYEREINRNSGETGIVESEEENDFSYEKYRAEEKRIREQPRLEYDESQKIFADNFKKKYGRNAFIFDDTNTDFGGWVSVLDNDTVLFGRNALRDYGQDFLKGHEVFEIINV